MRVRGFLHLCAGCRAGSSLLLTTGGTAGTLLGQPEMLHNIEVTQRTFPLGEEPGVDAGSVEVVSAGQPACLLAAQQRLQADGALAQPPLLLLSYHHQGHAPQRLLRLPPQPPLQLILHVYMKVKTTLMNFMFC
jgi:hypothetical protein